LETTRSFRRTGASGSERPKRSPQNCNSKSKHTGSSVRAARPRMGFVGRDLELRAIEDYLRDENDSNPLVVHGPSGTGKTALLARAAQAAKIGKEAHYCSVSGYYAAVFQSAESAGKSLSFAAFRKEN